MNNFIIRPPRGLKGTVGATRGVHFFITVLNMLCFSDNMKNCLGAAFSSSCGGLQPLVSTVGPLGQVFYFSGGEKKFFHKKCLAEKTAGGKKKSGTKKSGGKDSGKNKRTGQEAVGRW